MTSPRDESELVLYQTDDGITRLHARSGNSPTCTR
jgi:hypothetical protein